MLPSLLTSLFLLLFCWFWLVASVLTRVGCVVLCRVGLDFACIFCDVCSALAHLFSDCHLLKRVFDLGFYVASCLCNLCKISWVVCPSLPVRAVVVLLCLDSLAAFLTSCFFLSSRWRFPPKRWPIFLCTLWDSTARQKATDTKAKSTSESLFRQQIEGQNIFTIKITKGVFFSLVTVILANTEDKIIVCAYCLTPSW